MANLYVVGRVFRELAKTGEGSFEMGVYRTAAAAAKERFGADVYLPLSEPSLDIASPRDFCDEIVSRIKKSQAVVTVFTPRDTSLGAESAIAALEGKKQLILARGGVVPRILRGLPGVTDVLDSMALDIYASVSDFMRRSGF